MILLGFDVGRKKTGVAVGNLLTDSARPLAIARGGRSAQLAAIAEYVREWRPHKFVVGLPLHLDGGEHSMTRFCRSFAEVLRRKFELPVEFADERLTTAAARAESGEKGEADAAAAGIILRDWLRGRAAMQNSPPR